MAGSGSTTRDRILQQLDQLSEDELLAVLDFAQALGRPQTGAEYSAGLSKLAEEHNVSPEEAQEFWRCVQDGRTKA